MQRLMSKKDLPDFKGLEERITDPECLRNILFEDLKQLYKVKTPNDFFNLPRKRNYGALCAIIDELHQIRIVMAKNKEISNSLYVKIKENNEGSKVKYGEDPELEKNLSAFREQLIKNLNLSYPGDQTYPDVFGSFRYMIMSITYLLRTGKPYFDEIDKKTPKGFA